jgi:hypothetical protein
MRIRQVVSVGAGVGLIAALAIGCVTKKAAPYPDIQSFCNAKAQAECQIASTCLIDANDCQAHRAAVCNSDATAATEMGVGPRKYVQGNAQACIDALNMAYGGGNTKVSFMQLVGKGSIADLCARVFSGNASMNETCASPYDCTGDLICAPVMPGHMASANGGAVPSVCAPSVNVAAGGFCATPGSICATDSYCALPSASSAYECEPAMQQSQSCDPVTAPCASTQRCVSQTGSAAPMCQPRAKLGQACQSDGDCVPDAPYCDPYINKCTTGQSFASDAADCAEFTAMGAVATGSGSDAGGD